ncbi:hypothetical protein BCY88_37275 [Paraburkholderia fungorum]|uniref:Uncharacterized protein n=1 Tax=Paraburkholderia fungorum TaxID=134537 RepID=A0A3R7HDE0_9BURK|nr:hypothetical protein BCY88_37275 [Paraburkholderia fungorum]
MSLFHDQGKSNSAVDSIHRDQEHIHKDRYPDGLSSDGKHKIAERIKRDLPPLADRSDAAA